MEKKKIIVCFAAVCTACVCAFGLFHFKNVKNETNVKEPAAETKNIYVSEQQVQESKEPAENNNISQVKQNIKQVKVQKDVTLEKRTNLYDDAANSSMPLSVVTVLSEVPSFVKDNVEKISSSNNIFMAKKNGDKLFIITDNPANFRHSVEFTEISLINGHQVKTTLGYNDKIKDSDNDIWEYDKNTKKPTRHTKYNSDGDMEFVEEWYYDESNPIKYEMKDSDGKVVSMRKETLENGTDLRVEHLVYDKNGNTKVNVSATYDGPDVKRFTYYNADKPADSGSVFSEYANGYKTKETEYTSDLKVKNYYTTEYKDGNRESITIWNSQNQEVQKLLPKNDSNAL